MCFAAWLSVWTVLYCTWVLLIRPASFTSAFLRNGIRSAALRLFVELPEVSECCVPVESVTGVFPRPVFRFTSHSLEHFCVFLHVRFNIQVWVWLASLFLPQFHHSALVSPCCLSLLVLRGGWVTAFCRGLVAWADLRARSFDIAPVSDLPFLNGFWGFHLGSIPGSCRQKTSGDGHSRVMRGFLHASMVPALRTSVPCRLYCLCHLVAHRGVVDLLLT